VNVVLESVEGCCELGNEPSGFFAHLTNSQEELRSIKLISQSLNSLNNYDGSR
jgi:hypothetical protein